MASPVTTPGLSPRSGARGSTRRLARVVVAAACAVATTTGVAPLAGVPAARADTASLRLLTQPFAIVGQSTSRFAFEPVPGASDASTVTVAVHSPVISRNALRSIANREVGLRTNIDVVTATYSRLGRGQGGRILMPVEFNTAGGRTEALDVRRPGIYPVTVSVKNGRDLLAEAVTFVVRADPVTAQSSPPTPVTFMVEARGGLTHAPDGTSAVTEEARGALTSVLTMAANQPAGVSPLLGPEALAGFASSPDPRDAELLAQARAVFAGTTLTVGTFGPVDVSRLVAEGVSPELVSQYRLAEDSLALHLPGVRFARGVHVAHQPLTADGARAVADLGLRTVVFTGLSLVEAPVPPRPGVVTEFGLPSGIKMRGLQTLPGIAELLADPATTGQTDPAPWAGATDVQLAARIAAEVLAERADLLAEGVEPETIHLVVDATGAPAASAGVVSLAAGYVARIPDLSLAGLSTAADTRADSDARSVPLSDVPDYEPRLMDAIMFTLNALRDSVISMLPPEDPRPARWATILGIIPSLEPGEGLEVWASTVQGELETLTSSVSVSATSDITLGSRTGTIRIRLRNDSTTPLTVRVRLESAKLRFPGGPRLVTLDPSTVTDVDVKVTARTNGRFPVTMSVLTPQGGRQIVAPTTLTARVTALAGIGQFVSVTIALVLMAWWFSHWRRGRSRRQDADTADHTPADSPASAP